MIYIPEITVNKPKHINGEKWHLTNLRDITILFGKNGSGKSIFLRTLRDMKDCSYHFVSPERAGEIRFAWNIAEQQENPASIYAQRRFNMAPQFRQEAVAKIKTLGSKIGEIYSSKGEVDIDLGDIGRMVHVLLPHFDVQLLPSKTPPYKITRIPGGQPIESVDTLSSGESESFTVGLDILTTCSLWHLDGIERRVLLLDEPDLHLHPDLQQNLAEFIVSLVDRFNVQIFIATHSTTLLSALGFNGHDKVGVVYLDNRSDELQVIPFDKYLQTLTTCLGGHALMGPLFSAPLLLAEGDDDYKIWSHVPRSLTVNLAVIPCGGAGEVTNYQSALEKLFTSICNKKAVPLGYALLDGDQRTPQASVSNPQDFVKFINLNCRESENLYLTDEVLEDLGLDWNGARQKIKDAAKEYGVKQAVLESCDSWDRKKADLKNVIRELQLILDPKKTVPWTLRIAQRIGREKPTGQLREYLGDAVISAFWR